MPNGIGLPSLDILFKGLGVSAIQRGKNGSAALIVEDDTTANYFKKYETIADFTTDEEAKFTATNAKFIKDALEGIPMELYVICTTDTTKVVNPTASDSDAIADTLKTLGGLIPRNCWVAVVTGESASQDALATWIKAERTNNKKRYKGLVYKATTTDDMGIVDFTTEKVWETTGKDTELPGWNALAFMLGYLAGLPLSMSAIAKPLTKYYKVSEPDDLDSAIGNGEFFLFNDEGVVKVARGVNSLVTLGQDVTKEMCYINTIEKIDLIYCDIFKAWNDSYKGKYPNILPNQMLLISAINAYLSLISIDYILDPTFDNRVEVDLEKQRLANYPKYSEDVVKAWSDAKALTMTYSTEVYLKANIKITGIMEDFFMDIFM